MNPDLNGTSWRKSRFSGGEGGQCAEVYGTLRKIRDSKNPGPELAFETSDAWSAFMRSLKS